MSYTMYTPLNVWLDPASVTDVVAYIQTYLSENTIYSESEIETIIHDYLIAHPELIGGVQSVNGKTGTVVLSASDINTENNVTIESVLASLSSQISSIAASVATNTTNITSLTGRVSTAETDLANLKSSLEAAVNGHHYGVRWDKASAQMTRTGLAADITTTTTNFKHSGSVNANYNNPFDSIYPWSGRKLCNISLNAYRVLQSGDSITDCVVAWEGDPDFSYEHEDGVWVYTPEFWGTSYDEGGYRYFDVCDKPITGYVHYPAHITARNLGVKETRTIDGASKAIVLPKLGMPCVREEMSTIHTYAKNGGMTLDSIYSLDASILLMLVEFANYNSQSAIGQGTVSLYYENDAGLIQEAATSSTVIKVLASQAQALAIPGAIIDIGTSKGGNQVGTYHVVSASTSGTITSITLNEAVTVTTEHFYAIHGRIIVSDESIGSMSGYIGTDGKCDAYYRGESLWGNMWKYVLGAYKNTDEHVYLAATDADADNYDAINTSVHLDTGVVLSTKQNYIKTLGFPEQSGRLAAPCFCTEVGGSSSAPVGDYFYTNVGNARVLFVGGLAGSGAPAGLFCWRWSSPAVTSAWSSAGRPRLLNP